MGEMKHTPGPWIVGKGGPNGCPVVGNNKGLLVCMVSHSVNLPSQAEKARADAAAIAALPDLLDLAIRARDHAEVQLANAVADSNEADAATMLLACAQAALSKAEGHSLSSASGQEGGEA